MVVGCHWSATGCRYSVTVALIKRTIAYLCQNMIHFDALDFNECRALRSDTFMYHIYVDAHCVFVSS